MQRDLAPLEASVLELCGPGGEKPVAHLKSAIKKAERSEELAKKNKSDRSKVKKAVKDALLGPTAESARSATSVIDKAGAKGVIHKNAARRQKSRVARRVNAAQAAKTKA
jgi:small subunit ribosomal protein S20